MRPWRGAFVEAASSLAAWFGSRGVETVTFINNRGDDEGDEGPLLPPGPDGRRGDGDIEAKWTGAIVHSPRRTLVGTGIARRSIEVRQVGPGAMMMTHVAGQVLNWALIPYVHTPSTKQMKAFEQSLKDVFGSPLNKKAIVRSAKDSAVRRKLRDCYDALWRDHNLISMTLYCGPLKTEYAHVSLVSVHHHQQWFNEIGGWILTGDAHFDSQQRRQRFLRFYQQFTPLTYVLMLPHHGSIHNHSDLVLDAMPALAVGYASAGPNNYGHPHQAVRDAVNGHAHAHFQMVSDDRRSHLTMAVMVS